MIAPTPLRPLLLLITLGLGGFLALSTNADELPVRVSVYAEHQGGNVVYHYEVRNNGPGELREFYIGCECLLSTGVAELRALPLGTIASDDSRSLDIPLEVTTQPAGWRARIERSEPDGRHWLAWRMPAARANAGVMPNQTLAGFSITVPQADAAYLEGRYTAHVVHNGRRVETSAPLALLDTTPPTLLLQATPGPTDGTTATFRVVATAKDDRDPEPRVAVESVERSATVLPSGQPGYVITYSATDASGNRATASTTVRLPAAPAPATPPARGGMVQARAILPIPGVSAGPGAERR